MKTQLPVAILLGCSLLVSSGLSQEKAPKPARKAVPAKALKIMPAPARRAAPDDAELKKRLEKKLAGKWIKNAPWILDLSEAQAAAKGKDMPIFAYFTRSYAR